MAVEKPQARGGGRWVTIHGHPVFIKFKAVASSGPEADVGPGEPGFEPYKPVLPPADPGFRPLQREDRLRSSNWASESQRQINQAVGADVIREYTRHGPHVTRDPVKSAKLETVLSQFELPDNVTVYRKTGSDEVHKLVPGRTLVNPNFVSTSTSEAVALNFTGTRLLEIRLPRGAPAIDTSHGLSPNPAEHEVLVQRKQRYKVVEVRPDRTILELVR